ncbi:MAG: PD-(D/E)XK nuclease family protein [Patescibacteria group bacterium]
MYYHNAEQFKELCGYTIDGAWYPRVTKIVDIKSKPALYKYYAGLDSFQAGEEIKEKSASEGTLIHETLQDIMIGNSPTIDPHIKPSIEEAVKFIEQRNIQVDPEFIEKRVHSPRYRFAGTIDSLALIDGKFGVLDIKTSQAIYRDYSLQTSAYMDALKDQFSGLQTRWILRVDQHQTCLKCQSILRSKGGREKIRKPYPPPSGWKSCPENQHQWSELTGVVELKEFPYWKEDFSAFLAAKTLWEWENVFWLKKIGYI